MNPLQLSMASSQTEILSSLLRRLPGYTPEWALAPGAKGYALLDVLARYKTLLQLAATELPQRNLLAMLDMLAVHLLPAQAARAPVVFQLTPQCPVDVTVAADSQLAAQPPPPPPSLLANSTASNPSAVLFFTEETVTLARATLTALYSIDPDSDTYADHSKHLTDGFTVFGDMENTEHAIYLGHDKLFKLGGHEITLLLLCTLDAAPLQPMDIHWQYLSESGWITLQRAEEEDTTRGLTRDGQIALRLNCGPDAKKETFNGRTSYWLRGTLNTPVIRGENLRHNPLTVNDLRIRVQFKKKSLLPESAFADGTRLDVSKDFYPFGQQPATFNTFYLGSNQVFERGGARVHIDVLLAKKGEPVADANGNPLSLRWEYSGQGGWQELSIEPAADSNNAYRFDADPGIVDPNDTTKKTPNVIRISFNCPSDWREIQVNGAQNRWLRVRILQGSYNKIEPVTIASTNATVPVVTDNNPPVVASLTLSYTYLTDPDTLHHCLTRNNFQFEDHSDDAIWPDRRFDPFWPVTDQRPALHFGFDEPLPAGMVSCYVQVPGAEELEPGVSTIFSWEYCARGGWQQLGVRDETNGLRQSGMIQFIGPSDAVAVPGLGGELYRIRARLKDGVNITESPLSGLWLNAAWASHRVRIEQETLGTADGTPSQALRFARAPVLAGERLEIREWSGIGEGWRIVAQQVREQDLRYDRDPATGKIIAAWVRWYERPYLYDALPTDRVFIVERASGLLRFGDGASGMIPPAGSRIVATYTSGGGAAGNVPANSIVQLRSAVPFITSVTNPIAALGGADGEPVTAVRARGPQRLRHRDRAITASDIEWIARDASPEVARARCLDITGPAGHAQRGWITVIVVPYSNEIQPQPSPELQRRVAEYLRKRVPAAVVSRIQVIEPTYIPLKVTAEIVPSDPAQAALVEARVRRQLENFLHPLSGGSGANGRAFGEGLYLSGIAAVIETTAGVDYARDIRLYVGDGEHCQSVAVPRDALLCSGKHELKLTVGTR
jgi:hypothetical protein